MISFRATMRGLLKDHAVTVFYVLTTRLSTRSSYTTSLDSTSGLGGSLLGGLLGAITAIVVVRLSARGERRRALEREGRETVVLLTEAAIGCMHQLGVSEQTQATEHDKLAAVVRGIDGSTWWYTRAP
jgi:hypothetical protein